MLEPDNSVKQLKLPARKVSAWIETGGIKKTIWGPQVEGDLMSGFIESVLNEEFVLCYKFEMSTPDLDINARASADGSVYRSKLYRAESSRFTSVAGSPYRICEIQGTRVGKYEIRKMKFIPMNYSSNDSIVCRNDAILQGMGSIQLALSVGTIGDEVSHPRYHKGPVDLSPFARALEPEMENDHRVALGRVVSTSANTYYKFNPAKTDEEGDRVPFATFVFHYRSSDVLWRHGLVQTPTMLDSRPTSPYKNKDSLEAKSYAEAVDRLIRSGQGIPSFPFNP